MEAPAPYLPKARYAVETLLDGLGLAPRWVARDALKAGGLYYGPDPDAAPEAALALRLGSETVNFFEAPRPFAPDRMGSLSWDGTDWPLPFDGGAADGDKDVFASAFFWLSGWDEAARPARDVHGRFPFAGSLLEAVGAEPFVDAYRAWIGARLAAQGTTVPGRTWDGKAWAVALTFDVDHVRTKRFGHAARSLRKGAIKAAPQIISRGDARWDFIHRFKSVADERGARATWFFKAGAASPEDVRYRLGAPRLRHLLYDLRADGHEVGLHPSYAAYDHPGRLAEERDRLAAVLGEAPRSARMHYLRWAEPATPRALAAAGFTLDSTLGFSRHAGYRRAAATPFRLFDIEANAPLDLRELPLAVMDTTLFEHEGLSPEGAEVRAWAVCEAARRVGGCAILLWHNAATDPAVAAARLGVLERLLDRAQEAGAFVGSLGEATETWR